MISFEEVIDQLDEFTGPPSDGDYDSHTFLAMKAVYDLMVEACP